jgi:hypothetical protein
LFLGCLFLVVSCKDKQVPKEAIARVNDTYLYKADIADLVPENASEQDSMIVVANYIENWATEQLLLDRAKINLPMETQVRFELLVKDYREKLFIKAYKDALIARDLDSVFPDYEIEAFYTTHPEMFNLNENLLKLRYIHLSDSLSGFDGIKEGFIDFSDEDIKELVEQSLLFNSYSFNDSVWVSQIKVYGQIPPLSAENEEQLLKEESFLQLEDSLGVYLIYVNDVLLRGARAPLNYAKPTISQILRHKNKQELSKKLELEIKKDAIENNEFEIYD